MQPGWLKLWAFCNKIVHVTFVEHKAEAHTAP